MNDVTENKDDLQHN